MLKLNGLILVMDGKMAFCTVALPAKGSLFSLSSCSNKTLAELNATPPCGANI